MTFPSRSMICSVEGCVRMTLARGWCSTHYTRWRKHGDPLVVLPRGGARVMPPRARKDYPPCKFSGCMNLSVKGGKGWCGKHHTRWYRHGDPSFNGNQHRQRRDVMERIRDLIVEDEGCWIWQGALHKNGYGAFGTGARSNYAHRAAWEYVNGPVPDDLQLHHTCLHRDCVNPEHLVALTVREHRAAHRLLREAA